MTTIINGSSPSVTFSDGTTQTTAGLPLTGGTVTGNTSFTNATFSGGITFPYGTGAQQAPGKVLQVVSTTYSTQTSTTSTSYVSTSLTASITPLFSTSKILITVNTAILSSGTPNNDVYLTIYRGGSTNLGGGSQSSLSGQEAGSSQTLWTPASINYLDSPATTSSTAYALYFKVNGGTGYVFWGPTLSTITLMEIAA
jgi:hypothetical protein